MEFVKIHFLKSIFQKSSADKQGRGKISFDICKFLIALSLFVRLKQQ